MAVITEILSFYTPYASVDKMKNALQLVLGESIASLRDEHECFHIQLKSLETLRIPYVSHASKPEVFQEQLQRLYGSTQKKSCANPQIQQNLLYQIALFQAAYVIEFDYEKQDRDQKILPLMEIADQMDALIFWETGDISDSYGDVILSRDGSSEVELFNPIDSFDLSDKALGLSEQQLKRMHRSISVLRYKGIYAPNNIAPPIDELYFLLQDKESVIKRCVACMILAIYSDFLEQHEHNTVHAYDYVEKMIRLYRSAPYFTSKEIEYLNNPRPSDEEIALYHGYFECCYTMLWALNLAPHLYFPSAKTSDSFVVRTIFSYASIDKLIEHSQMRGKGELLDAIDLVQRYHWACIDADKLHFEMPSNLIWDCVALRHKALTWIANADTIGWDEVQPTIKPLSKE